MIQSLTMSLRQAIHRDPFGSRPRATLFATEGLKLLDAKLAGSDCQLASVQIAPHHMADTCLQICHLRQRLPRFQRHWSTSHA